MGQICVNIHKDCGFCGKSTKIGIYDVKGLLIDFRYSTKQDFFREAHKVEKSKMAAGRFKISVNCHIFMNSQRRNLNEVSFCMFLYMTNPMEPLFALKNAYKSI